MLLTRRRKLTNCIASNNILAFTIVNILLININIVNAITNTQEQQLPQYTHHLQYPAYTEQLNRGQLSSQEQSHILSDVQQHRFLVNVGERPRAQDTIRSIPPTFHQSPLRLQHQPQPHQQQPLFSGQQTFHHQFPQDNFQIGNIGQTFANSYHSDKKPILLQPTYSQDYKQPQPPPQQTFHTSNKQQQKQTLQPTYQPVQQHFQPSDHSFPQPTFQSNFPPPTSGQFDNNYVIRGIDNLPQQHSPKIVTPSPPAFQENSYTPETPKYQTQSWILETQPPTSYKKQKPYEAITFATESYKSISSTPKVVKYRPRPIKQEDKYISNGSEQQGELYIKPDRKKLYDQLVVGTTKGQQHVTTVRSVSSKRRGPTTTTTTTTTTPSPPQLSDEQYIQEQLQKQIQEQLGSKDDLFKTLKITLPGELSPDQIANLPNIALGDSVSQLPELSSQLTQSLYLGNDQKVKLAAAPPSKPSRKGSTQVKTIVVNQPQAPVAVAAPTTTIKPPTVLFEELTKNVLPPGANFELIRHKQDGALEEVGNIQNFQQKKVTFVILEEQPDGSVKVQGVRGNENGDQDSKESDVESIIERLKKGEIKLPPSTKLSNGPQVRATPQESQASPNYVKHENKVAIKPTSAPRRRQTTTPRVPVYVHSTPIGNTHAGPSYTVDDYNSKRSTTAVPPKNKPEYTSPVRNNLQSFLPTATSQQNSLQQYTQQTAQSIDYSFSPSPTFSIPSYGQTSPSSTPSPPTTPYNHHLVTNDIVSTPVVPQLTSQSSATSVLSETLRSNGLFAMAKFLKQSGLDSVLNETGPYTLFIPTDKAFRALLVQLGGPDRAEIKFKENPRLLSGLLLHHVIPGAFKVDSLLDEMTGVSLAGTQLRVNTYSTQDQEWNDVKVVTINGAKVLQDRSDIVIPQGVAHTVDRVMFPLPVGDIMQTLMSDREARFSKFIKLLKETGVAQSLQGTKSYTVFAPTDAAFTDGEVERLLEQRAAARSLALRHVTPGTLYSAGMLYYQLRDSMSSTNQIQLSKEAGRVKVNNAHVISRNIPATNGVIHAIDSLL